MSYINHHIVRTHKKYNMNIPVIMQNLRNTLNQNTKSSCFIGHGYYDSFQPPILTNTFLKNPKWYTPYTPYQAEISQGRLEMLNNFQNLIKSLTGMKYSNASLLDECNAACEASNMAFHYYKKKKNNLLIHKDLHLQVKNSLKLKTKLTGTKLIQFNNISDLTQDQIKNSYAIIFQNPTTEGHLLDLKAIEDIETIKICGVDPLSLFLLKSPAEYKFDISYGSVNRLGLGLSYGGPHAGFISCQSHLIRYLPGRIVTEAEDKYGIVGLRLGLQTREQHIKKEGALSNICTAQSLPAVIATSYVMYHGKEGIINLSNNLNKSANMLKNHFENENAFISKYSNFFDTVAFSTNEKDKAILNNFLENEIEFGKHTNCISFSIDEVNQYSDLINQISDSNKYQNHSIPESYLRHDNFLSDDIFSGLSELELTRYFDTLASKDYSLTNGMIPLGSCTMKHTTPWSMSLLDNEKLNIHPYTANNNAKGYNIMFKDLQQRLYDHIGLPIWFFQSQSGAMGELSGLYTINNYFGGKRKIILIPDNAHGTNFTSASLAGFTIKKIKTVKGEINIDDIENIIQKEGSNIAGIMITYPSTFGFFDENVEEVIKIIKNNGSKVYLDGANMNALVGVKKLSDLNIDVCHLNLHKTFSIPHGGGGPGMGPIGLTEELEKYLPKDPLEGECISGHKFGSGALCSITWSYLNLLENDIAKCTLKAIENSNYLKNNLKDDFKIHFIEDKKCSHEFLIDTTEFNKLGYNDNLICKRLMDYEFHAPTVSWPLKNVLMIEPTESEPKKELDRFIKAMKGIKKEMLKYNVDESPLINAPHTQRDLLNWNYNYSIEEGCYPLGFSSDKYWPSINKLDEVKSDRNLLIQK